MARTRTPSPTPRDPVAALRASLGAELRRRRTARRWSLDNLAERSGVSRGMILQVEAARTNPSIATLVPLADALGVPLAALLATPAPSSRLRLLRPDDRSTLWSDGKGSEARLVLGTGEIGPLELWEWRLAAGARYDSPAHPAGTQEILRVHAGRLTVRTEGEDLVGGPGGILLLTADRDHTYRNTGRTLCRFDMLVLMPTAATPRRGGSRARHT